VWRNKESQPTAPTESSVRVAENSSTPKVPSSIGSTSGTTAPASSWLTPSMRVKGDILGNEDLVVDGKVEGSISVGEHKLTVGRNGQVTGGLAAREIIIHGKVDGNHSVVSESIEIKKEASVVGNVITRRIVIEDSAGFKGSIEIIESGQQLDLSPESSASRALSKSA
jgi:cytoskeletal protein CcmA (bactofilin family)